jgi:GNAT superfamily N-acetyltransferase
MNPVVAPLVAEDRAAWEVLARGYKAFYKTETSPAEYDTAWQRLLEAKDVHGLGAKVDGRLVGITHYLFHATIWAPTACYLQDLFVARDVRGRGIARALIEAVADEARRAHATRYYWMTQDHNTVARTLYDKVARFNGFIRYEFAL